MRFNQTTLLNIVGALDTPTTGSILYGGRCKGSNAPELFVKPDIDGGLIGGASLKAADFLGIVDAWK